MLASSASGGLPPERACQACHCDACAGEEAAVKFFKPGTFHSLDEIEKV